MAVLDWTWVECVSGYVERLKQHVWQVIPVEPDGEAVADWIREVATLREALAQADAATTLLLTLPGSGVTQEHIDAAVVQAGREARRVDRWLFDRGYPTLGFWTDE